MRRTIARPLVAGAICLGLGVSSYGQDFLSAVIEGDAATFPVGQTLVYEVLRWAYWAPVILLLFHLPTALPPDRRGRIRLVALHVAVGVPVLVVQAFYHAGLVKLVFGEASPYLQFVRVFLTRAIQVQSFTYVAILGAHLAIAASRRARDRERVAAELETQLARAQLRALEAQLHPHFLFNALQTVAMLVKRNPDEAARTVARLGDLLRVTLDRTGVHEVSLAAELEMLALYLDIERTRFPDRLRVDIDVPDELRATAVPSLILQPLVENAFRYAVEPRAGGGTVRIGARRDDGRVRLAVSDDGPGLPRDVREGIGLTNTRERLRALYGEDTLTLGRSAFGGCEASIALPVQAVPS